MKSKIIKLIHARLYPERCPFCLRTIKPGEYLCRDCEKQIPSTYSMNYAVGGYPCCSPFFYQGIFKNAIKNIKFKSNRSIVKKLVLPLAECIEKAYDLDEIEIITYVPMHKNEQKERGFNQSELLAKGVSKLLGIPCRTLLEKHKENKRQHECPTRAQRRNNVKNVYRICDNENIKGKTILIIDDILTTGITLGECAYTLERFTHSKILCATFCARNNLNE